MSAATIRGEARATCIQWVDSHRVTLYLELLVSGAWQVMDEDTSTKIPHPRSVELFVLDVCRPGTWRLRYSVVAAVHGQTGKETDFSDRLGVVSDDCKLKGRTVQVEGPDDRVVVEVRVVTAGAVRHAKFKPTSGEREIEAAGLLSRISDALKPEFEPDEWHMDYLPVS